MSPESVLALVLLLGKPLDTEVHQYPAWPEENNVSMPIFLRSQETGNNSGFPPANSVLNLVASTFSHLPPHAHTTSP